MVPNPEMSESQRELDEIWRTPKSLIIVNNNHNGYDMLLLRTNWFSTAYITSWDHG
jgi:hypothetical protein